MRKAFTGVILILLSMGFVIHSYAVRDTAQCISTFEGQNSLVCRTGESSILQGIFFGLSLIGLLLIIIARARHFGKKVN